VLRLKRAVNPVLIWLAVAAVSLAAFAAVALEAPVGLRLVASAVLLLVPGIGLVRVLLPPRNADGDSDAALVLPLSLLLGVLAWLGAVMALSGFGIDLSPTTIALTLTGAGVVFTGLAIAQGDGVPRPIASMRGIVSRHYRDTIAVVATGLLLGGATAVAVELIPTPTSPYTTIGLVDNTPFGDSAPVAAAGSMVRLNWVVRGFGCELSPALTSIRLAIDGVSVGDVAVDVSPDTTPDVEEASASISGAVTFPAPTETGKHTVQLFVLPIARDGADVPTPGYVSTPLVVTA
jgi:hypothetical protein